MARTVHLEGVYGGPPDRWWLTCGNCGGKIFAGEMAWITEEDEEYLGAVHEECPA